MRPMIDRLEPAGHNELYRRPPDVPPGKQARAIRTANDPVPNSQ